MNMYQMVRTFSTRTTGISGDVRVVNIRSSAITNLIDGHGRTTIGTLKGDLNYA